MTFNTEKCKIMHVGRGNPDYDYSKNNVNLSETEKERDIGVIIHKSLKPLHHCIEAARKARSFHYRDKITFVKLYTTYVRPHLEFSTAAWNPWLQKDEEVLEMVQIRAINMVSGLQGASYEQKLAELGMCSMKQRRLQFDMLQTFKIVHVIDKVDHSSWFEFIENRGDRVTRLSGDPLNLKLKRANTEIRRNFFSHRVVNAWNQIPTTIKNARTTSSFKSQFNNYMPQQHRSNHQN